ncbi:MAG: hypothetical protein ABIH76_00770 [Candidatus Bathyarchaeota archaeon]
MKDVQTLQEEIYSTLEELDDLILPKEGDEVGRYAKEIANSEYLDAKRKFVVAEEKDKFEGSEAYKQSKAEASQAFIDHIRAEKKARGMSLQVKAMKDLLERRHDGLRTLLSFEGKQINRLT